MPEQYVQPNWLTRNVFNRIVVGLTRLGISLWGSRILEVRGRKSGETRRVPVNMLTLNGARYLVAPRGHTQWSRNLRVALEGTSWSAGGVSASRPPRSRTRRRSRSSAHI